VPRPHDGNELPHARRNSVLRGVGFALAVALGAVGVWLLVTGTSSPKRLEVGVLTGLWGLLLGAFSVFGSRHPLRHELADAPGQALAMRPTSELDRADDAAARRHFEARLEHMLRREIQTSMAREVSTLREEVGQLRIELLDKVGGQLQLERIETTRVIGSDIEALQREINQLKGARLFDDPTQTPPITRVATSRVVEPDPARSPSERMPASVRPILPMQPPAADREPLLQQYIQNAYLVDASDLNGAQHVEDAHVIEDEPPVPSPPLAAPPVELPKVELPPIVVPTIVVPTTDPPTAAAPSIDRLNTAGPSLARVEPPPVTDWFADPLPPLPAAPPLPAPPLATPPLAAPSAASGPPPTWAWVPPTQPTFEPPPEPAPPAAADPFDALPRLRPFTDFELDPIEPIYNGRRRAGDAGPPPRPGRHGAPEDDRESDERPRHHQDENGHDVLSQILHRGSTR
jgi:hypothetical protein